VTVEAATAAGLGGAAAVAVEAAGAVHGFNVPREFDTTAEVDGAAGAGTFTITGDGAAGSAVKE
jgi:hypothetical protein